MEIKNRTILSYLEEIRYWLSTPLSNVHLPSLFNLYSLHTLQSLSSAHTITAGAKP